MVVQRYLPNGDTDPSFGHNGTAVVSFGTVNTVDRIGLLIRPGNRILVAGLGSPASGEASQLLVGLRSDGHIDAAFGNNGYIPLDPRISLGAPPALATTPDGGFVAGGSSSGLFAVARYGFTGSLDSGFGDAGVARGSFSSTQQSSGASSVSVDRAGRILVGGGVSGTGFTSMALARLLGDGSFDAAFGQQGRVSAGTQQTPASVITFTSNVFELADGDLLAVGSQNNGGFHGGCDTTAVVRLNPDGTPDDAFGADGVQRHQNSCAMVRSAMLGTGDQLTVAGAVFDYTASSSAYSGFGPSGSTFNGELAAKRQGFLTDATLMPNGDVLLAGNVTSDTCAVGTLPQGTLCSAVVLKEIESDGDPESAFGDSGTVSYPSVEPVLDRSRFQLLIAESMPESVRVRHGRLTVQLKCPGAVRSGCTFDLVLRMRHGRLVHLPETEVGAGRAKHLTQDIGSAQTGSHGSLRGEVSSPGQSPVNVNARVTIRG